MAGNRFEGASVIVTGAASGLGSAAASQFAREGASLVLVDLDEPRLRHTAQSIAAEGAAAHFLVGDVSRQKVATDAVNLAMRQFGRIDVLVNNAGIDPLAAKSITATSEAQWDEVMNVNVKSAFLFSQAVLAPMLIARAGALVHVASISGVAVSPDEAAYSVSKAALIGLSRTIAIDYARYGVRSNCIAPGILEAVMGDRRIDLSPAALAERTNAAAAAIPLGREGTYPEIARSILFLASRDSAYVTGQTLVADGGLLLA
jgi:NAD(P)-dependent dehydrogenase (short-subunit alcohol dehydrogenase family)